MIGRDKQQIVGNLDAWVETHRGKIDFYQSYVLHHWQEQAGSESETPISHFALQEVMGEQRQHVFKNFEQVMNFLIDELFRKPKRQ
jgi:hypothetical protein